jgi:hypothetical protein
MQPTHDNLWVCAKCWEPQHPQELIRSTPDKIAVEVARPEPTEYYVEAGDITADDL